MLFNSWWEKIRHWKIIWGNGLVILPVLFLSMRFWRAIKCIVCTECPTKNIFSAFSDFFFEFWRLIMVSILRVFSPLFLSILAGVGSHSKIFNGKEARVTRLLNGHVIPNLLDFTSSYFEDGVNILSSELLELLEQSNFSNYESKQLQSIKSK